MWLRPWSWTSIWSPIQILTGPGITKNKWPPYWLLGNESRDDMTWSGKLLWTYTKSPSIRYSSSRAVCWTWIVWRGVDNVLVSGHILQVLWDLFEWVINNDSHVIFSTLQQWLRFYHKATIMYYQTDIDTYVHCTVISVSKHYTFQICTKN